MTVALWIVLGLMAWVLLPVPLAVMVGRCLRDSGASDRADRARDTTPLALPLG